MRLRAGWLVLLGGLLLAGPSWAADQAQAAAGVKEALASGVKTAITQLGKKDGFLGDSAVRIGLPGQLGSLAKTARKFGQGKYVDKLEESMNRAAEQAVPAAADILSDAVRAMSVQDAVGIVSGGSDSATKYFRRSSGDKLKAAILPIVKQQTSKTGVANRYKDLSKKGGGLLGRLGGGDSVDLDDYVTDKTLDGLFHVIAEQEASIRSNPMATGSSILKSVFGH